MRVVVADNDLDALELVTTDLGLEGHEIVAAVTDGDGAAAACRSEQPDVLVIDYRMPPGPDGLEIAARVRDELPETRVVIYSNYQSVELVRQARELGATFLPKGNIRALRRAVQP